jgi:hypothetical protein
MHVHAVWCGGWDALAWVAFWFRITIPLIGMLRITRYPVLRRWPARPALAISQGRETVTTRLRRILERWLFLPQERRLNDGRRIFPEWDLAHAGDAPV